jgi:Ca-activated chloride channel family protein
MMTSVSLFGASWSLAYPWVFVAAVLLLAAVAWYRRGDSSGTLLFSATRLLTSDAQSVRVRLRRAPALVRTAALLVLALGIARPQIDEAQEETVEGIDVFVVLDMSGSMLAVDMTPGEVEAFQVQQQSEPPNRFDNAIVTLKRFVQQRERDRIGMVVFAADAFLQFPLTLDYSTILGLLDDLQINQINATATAIGNALGLAVRGLLDSEARSKAIILITDGKQQGGNISPTQAAQLAADESIRIFPILVGRDGPTMAPTDLRIGRFLMYQQTHYPVDPELLNQIATMTDGAFYQAENREELEQGLGAILDELETTVLQEVSSVSKTEMFQPFIGLAMALLALDVLLRWLLLRRFP